MGDEVIITAVAKKLHLEDFEDSSFEYMSNKYKQLMEWSHFDKLLCRYSCFCSKQNIFVLISNFRHGQKFWFLLESQ